MLNYIILGIVQGLTEFLPVSSSGHLLILQQVLGVSKNQLAITVILHLGTVGSLIVFFFKDLLGLAKNFKLLAALFLVTVITVVIGLAGKDFFENLFVSPKPVAFALALTGLVLIITKKYSFGKKEDLTLQDAFILGIAQSIAIIPGISRSGITVSTLLFRKISPASSFRFSFLAAIPVIFGAAIFEARKINLALKEDFLFCFIGFWASFFSGLIALKILKLVLVKAKLYYFGYYCIIIAVITLIFLK
ncbi:MAG: undecaprenyl-diphosphate phosphatase [Candidatus Omnitrophota bacterium]